MKSIICLKKIEKVICGDYSCLNASSFKKMLHDHCSFRPFEKAKEYDIFISGYNSISVDWGN